MVSHHSPSSSVDTVRAYPPLTPPLPPQQEEDLGLQSHRPPQSKGKGRETDSEEEEDEPENGDEVAEAAGSAYPPTNDEEAETRRIEENLRKLEIAERQRRKAKRESSQSDAGSTLVGEVTRRVSLLWRGRTHNGRPSISDSALGTHTQLQSEDTDVPLHSVATVATPPRANTPENPFISAADNEASPFADPERPAIMTATSESTLKIPEAKKPKTSQFSKPRPKSHWNPPKPLDLPPPVSPPPLNPAEFIQPAATPSPQIQPHPAQEPEKVRWWHEWLCGLSEGADRGGDKQSGRTNPFE